MTWTTLLLLAQYALSLPPLGFVNSPAGLLPLYGMRGNFLYGEPLPKNVQSAVRLRGFEAWKLAGEIRIGDYHLPSGDGRALFAADTARETLYIWLQESGVLIRWTRSEVRRVQPLKEPGEVIALGFARNVQLFSRGAEGIVLTEFDGLSLEPLDATTLPAAAAIAVDSLGNRWLAIGNLLTCGTGQWILDSDPLSLDALDEGWVLITTASGVSAARCDISELSPLPATEPAP